MSTGNATRAEFLAAREPSRPPGVSLWQLYRGFTADPFTRWTQIREQHGDVARYRYGFDDVHFVSHPEGARRVLQDNVANYTKEHPSYGMLRRLVGNGLLTSEGSFWLRQRRLAQPAFHRQRIAAMGGRMALAAAEAADGWRDRLASGATFPMLREMSRLTLRIVGDALFGSDLPQTALIGESWELLNNQLVERFNKLRLLPPILPTRYDRDFRRARQTLFGIVAELIAERRARPAESPDLLSMLMAAEDEETGERMTDAQLRDEVVTMILAGHETTSVALSWTWALLDRHPEARRSLDAELARVLAGRTPSAEDVQRLPFTRAVIDESMRLYPPAYILFRRIKAYDVVRGCRIHKGGVVVITPMMFHRHPEFWSRPDDFLPERWADAEAEKRRPRFAFMPFSGGPRQCIGNNFAMMEAVIILATLAQRYHPRLAEGYTLQPEYLVTLHPVGGLPMRLEAAGA